jgi:glutamine amidotransferase
MDPELILLNYGAGNMASIRNALTAIAAPYRELAIAPLPDADNAVFILPGVGSFAEASASMRRRGFDRLSTMKPRLVGICLGMQLLFSDSTEGGMSAGLGLLPGSVRAITAHPSFEENLRLPHVGWQPLQIHNNMATSALGCTSGQDVYFVHSFMAYDIATADVWASVDYGSISIPAVVAKDGVVGFQFHPEKSGPAGLNMLRQTLDYLIHC